MPAASSPRRSPAGSPRRRGIDIGRIAGSGPHGRIIARDVEAAKSGGTRASRRAAAVAAPGRLPRRCAGTGALRRQDPRAVRARLLRRRAARQYAQDHRAAPGAGEADDPALLSHRHLHHRQAARAREDINATAPKDADGKPAWKLSVNDFVIKALALALMKVPDANVTWTEAGMLQHKHADIGDRGRDSRAG